MQSGFIAEPIEYFQTSIKLKPNPVAYRCLAVLQSTVDATINLLGLTFMNH
jgi:hypothetical protein